MKEKVMNIEDVVRKLGGVWPVTSALMGAHGVPFRIEKGVLYRSGDSIFVSQGCCANGFFICTREEFDECASRLRNEPDWKHAPDWAVAKAQDSDGCWWWYSAVPGEGSITFSSNEQVVFACEGEIIGDWRETLRLRPENKVVEEVMPFKTIKEAYGFFKGVWPESFTLKTESGVYIKCDNGHLCSFSNDSPYLFVCTKEQFENIAWADVEKDSAPDNGWHERGEYPPVGTVCLGRVLDTSRRWVWTDVEVLKLRDNEAAVHALKLSVLRWCDKFRPIQTDRDRLIEKAKYIVKDARTPGNAVSLLDKAGMLKMTEEK